MKSLSSRAFEEAVRTFEQAPFHPQERLEASIAIKFFASLSTDVPMATSALFIDNEDFWKRACQETGKSLRLEEHCFSYKHLFFEQYIQHVVKSCSNDRDILIKAVTPFSEYIYTLKLEDLTDEFPIDALMCASLPNLSKLELHFGSQGRSTRFQPLAAAITSTPLLLSLSLKNSNVTDQDLIVMFGSMAQCNITHLDLSHNKITSTGVEVLVEKFLSPSSFMSHLHLSGNEICDEGAAKIGAALMKNQSLRSLDIGLNKIGDEGCLKLFEGVALSTCLLHLNLSANKLGSESAKVISQYFAEKATNASIESIELTSNPFSVEDLKILKHKTCFIRMAGSSVSAEKILPTY